MPIKRNKFWLLASLVPMVFLSTGCNIGELKGSYAFVFRSTGNIFGTNVYKGFGDILSADHKEAKYFDKSPSETNVGSQIQMIETLTLQQVGSITISASGGTGYDPVLQRATEKGIKIVSVDSPISPRYRSLHIQHVPSDKVGTWLARAATLIAAGIEYNDKGPDPDHDPWTTAEWAAMSDPKRGYDDLPKPVSYALNKLKTKYETTNKKTNIGILSATQDSTSQNEWNKYTFREFTGVSYDETPVAPTPYTEAGINMLNIQYGDDEPYKSRTKAAQLINEGADVIISPTTIGIFAAADEIAETANCKTKLTGLGMPSECAPSMPDIHDKTTKITKSKVVDGQTYTCTATKDKWSDPEWHSDDGKFQGGAFNFVCPYMMLWNVQHLGQAAAEATYQIRAGKIQGKVGDKFDMKLRDFKGEIVEEKTYTVEADPDDGGTRIIALDPMAFTSENITDWKDIL